MAHVVRRPIPLGIRRWLALAALGLGQSVVVLNATMLAVALPVLLDRLNLDFAQAQWINAIYAVVVAALLITTGRLGDRLGHRSICILGLLVFIGGSLLAAAATEPNMLLWGRIVQGVGAAGVLSGTLSTVNTLFPGGRHRMTDFAGWGALLLVMGALGPLLGGWLTTSFTWPWIFVVNVVLGVVALIMMVAFLPETGTGGSWRDLDVDGFLLGGAGFALVVFALVEGQVYGWWRPVTNAEVVGVHWSTSMPFSLIPVALLLGVILLALFLRWERHRDHVRRSTLLDLDLFRIPSFRRGNAVVFVVALCEYGLLFVLPLFLVNVLGLSTLRTGVVLAVMAGGALLASGAHGELVRRLGTVRVVRSGLLIEVLAAGAMALAFTPHLSSWLVGLLLFCYGIGLGLASARLIAIVQSGVREPQSGQGVATQTTVRQVGSALGSAALGSVLSLMLSRHLADRLAGVPNLPHETAGVLARTTRDSAGTTIPVLRRHGGTGAVVDALSRGFTDATRFTLLAIAIVLMMGLLAVFRLPDSVGDETADNPEDFE
jgi:EmrB/QacA subfamily drug resistance transporter